MTTSLSHGNGRIFRGQTSALVSLLVASWIGVVRLSSQPTPSANDRGGLTGSVRAADGRPVAGGVARLAFLGSDTEAPIDASGRFGFDAIQPGDYELQISAPDLATQRLRVRVPENRRLALPPIKLAPPAYLRVRLLSPSGEPIVNPGVLYESYEVNGKPIPARPGERVLASTDADGVTSIGPLPRGIFAFALDAPPWARTRLPDLLVTGEKALLDAGTVRLEAGVTLDVDVFGETGAPVPDHAVSLDDGSPLLATRFFPTLTDAHGRARIERLASGPYRVRTRSTRKCGIYTPLMERRVTISSGAPVRQRVVVSGVSVAVRLTSGGSPLASTEVFLSPEIAPPALPAWLKGDSEQWLLLRGPLDRIAEAVCGDTTDRDGLVTIRYVPAGPARASVRFANSTWVRRVSIPPRDGDLTLDVPQGVVSLRVLDERNGEPATGAAITWTSGGGQVEARVPATGDALLEGIFDGPAELVVRRVGYQPFKQTFPSPPPVLYAIVLQREPERTLRCRVLSEDGEPVAGAVVELVPGDPLELTELAGTDRYGWVPRSGLPAGPVRLTATAPGCSPSAPALVTLPTATPGAAVTLTLKCGAQPPVFRPRPRD